ncbi:hypothetical protein TWF481_004746 [Arthrobotrys musiformis]|uniref:Non-repetitive/WGA-negative nucleoporin C-terminal-domain-containing protein n=1 Tax=Arthrobotrys musiformis TaxID=47236 RepID=A0AAV9WKK5_9PEZI
MTDPLYTSQQSNASMLDQPSTQTSANTSFSTQSRRRPRPTPSSQNSLLSASNSLHPTKKVRQRSVSAQRELNASPEAMAAVAAATMDVSSIRSLQDKKKGSLVEWAKTTKYCVAQLTGLPMELRDSGDNYAKRMSAITDQSSGNALLIKDHGVDVWRYDDVQLLPKPNHFPLPSDETSHHTGGFNNTPQPLGSLVSPTGSSDEAGLVVVMPVTGRIAYWDSVSSAMTEGLLQRRRGVEGVLPLSSGEQAHMIANIEPAGFIICTNQNRVIHLSLRDGVGKPVVQLTTLKNIGSSVVGGLLGGLASAFKSGNVRKEIVAVRPGRIIGRAERELLVATSHGHITRWEVSRNGAAVVLSDVDMREQIISRVLSVGPQSLTSLDREAFTILDIASGQSTAEGANVLILTSWDERTLTGENITHYTLILATLYRGSQFSIKKAHYISCFQQSLRTAADTAKPRLYLPNPYRTAFLVFSRAVVLVSIVPEDLYELGFGDNIPDVTHDSVMGFEEVIDFKAQSRVEIIGSGVEELTQEGGAASFNPAKGYRIDSSGDLRRKYYSPGVVIITKGAGVLKLTVFDAETADLRPLPSPRPVPVKSKMELAVFFGTNEKNLLNFNGRREITYPTAEVQQAARNLSMDLMCSHGQYLATFGPSIDIYLESRAQKLLALAEYLRAVHRQISREIRWKLLWDAEKMESARAVYRAFAQKQSAGKDLSEGLLLDVITAFFVKHDVKTVTNPMVEWFAKHLPRIYELIPLLREAVVTAGGNTVSAVRKIHESNEITLTILATAQGFRLQHAKLYSVDGDLGPNGLADFRGLESPPWTSGPEILTALNRDIEVNTKVVGMKKEGLEGYFGMILDQMVEMVEVACRNFVERAGWCEVQGGGKYAAEGVQIRDLYLKGRNQWIRAIAFHDRADQAVDIAERYGDYVTLVELAFEELGKINGWLEKRGQEVGEGERQEYISQRDGIVSRLEGYFGKFGREFAEVLYGYQVEMGDLRDLLVQFPAYKEYLDGFLKGEAGRYSRVRWINEVRDGRYKEAGETLMETADREECLWSQAVELSIGKLALMAQSSSSSGEPEAFDRRLKMVELQKAVQARVCIEARGAIDVQAGTELAFGAFGGRVEPYRSLRDVFKRGVAKAVTGQSMGVEELVDFLTLMYEEDGDLEEEDEGGWVGRFQSAILALGIAEVDDVRKEEARRAIWRRMWLSEDWLDILDPERQNTTQIETRIMNTNIFDVLVYGYREGLFDEHKASTPLAPTQTGFTRNIDFLAARFAGSAQGWLQNLYEEIKIEEREVRRLVENNLEFWFPWMCESAMKMAAEEGDETVMEDEEEEDEEEDAMDMS